jgi:IclR helix-turn-helix domain
MTDDQPTPISITLSPVQVDAVIRATSLNRAPSVASLLAGALHAPRGDQVAGNGPRAPDNGDRASAGGLLGVDDRDPRLSRSLLRGLAILAHLGRGEDAYGIVELAGELGMSPSTAYRYAATLVELGLLERCPRTRKYRLAGSA